ncbi:MAG: MFS transporter [Clostridia bacterium]|nr:MFS transporter [Clostridia bacterium]
MVKENTIDVDEKMTVKKLVNKKYVFALVFLCAIIYFVSYVTRINYSAVLVEVMKSEGFTKTAASVPLTGLFIVYGAGQLISGVLGDKFCPEKIIFFGLLLTCGMNVLLPLAGSTHMMTVIWSINGFAQALMWPPLVKILTKHLTKDDYAMNIVYIHFGSSLGTIFVYAVSPVVISFSGWRYVFFGAAALSVIVAVIWRIAVFKIEKHTEYVEIYVPQPHKTERDGKIPFTYAALLLLFLIMFTNIFQGLLRDGITTWMPTYMSDVFGFDSSSAILTGIALPVATMIVSHFTATIYRKILKNEAKCTTLFFSVCTVCCLVLCLAGTKNPALSTAMLMLANAATHAINFIYTSIAVSKFERFNKTSFVTGAINSSVYIGSALSTYGIAKITTHFGWSGTMITWFLCAVIGLVICVLSIRHFKKEL